MIRLHPIYTVRKLPQSRCAKSCMRYVHLWIAYTTDKFRTLISFTKLELIEDCLCVLLRLIESQRDLIEGARTGIDVAVRPVVISATVEILNKSHAL
jgi:hypothetical protein